MTRTASTYTNITQQSRSLATLSGAFAVRGGGETRGSGILLLTPWRFSLISVLCHSLGGQLAHHNGGPRHSYELRLAEYHNHSLGAFDLAVLHLRPSASDFSQYQLKKPDMTDPRITIDPLSFGYSFGYIATGTQPEPSCAENLETYCPIAFPGSSLLRNDVHQTSMHGNGAPPFPHLQQTKSQSGCYSSSTSCSTLFPQ